MLKKTHWPLIIVCYLPLCAQALEALPDAELGAVSAQDGLTLQINPHLAADRIGLVDNGRALQARNLSLQPLDGTGHLRFDLDIDGAGGTGNPTLTTTWSNLAVTADRLTTDEYANQSLGAVSWRGGSGSLLIRNRNGFFNNSVNSALFVLNLTDNNFFYRDVDSNTELAFADIDASLSSDSVILGLDATQGLHLATPTLTVGNFTIGSIGLRTDITPYQTSGIAKMLGLSFTGSLTNFDATLRGGGRIGPTDGGMSGTLRFGIGAASQLRLADSEDVGVVFSAFSGSGFNSGLWALDAVNATDATPAFLYNGTSYSSTASRSGLALTLRDASLDVAAGSVLIGNSPAALGGLHLALNNINSDLLIQPGIDATNPTGIHADALKFATSNSSFRFVDDGNRFMGFTNLQASFFADNANLDLTSSGIQLSAANLVVDAASDWSVGAYPSGTPSATLNIQTHFDLSNPLLTIKPAAGKAFAVDAVLPFNASNLATQLNVFDAANSALLLSLREIKGTVNITDASLDVRGADNAVVVTLPSIAIRPADPLDINRITLGSSDNLMRAVIPRGDVYLRLAVSAQ